MVVCYVETNQMPSVQSQGGALVEALNASALVEQFLSEADIARSTKETYRRALRQFFRWHESQNMQESEARRHRRLQAGAAVEDEVQHGGRLPVCAEELLQMA